MWLAWESLCDLSGTDTFAETVARIEAIRRRTGGVLLRNRYHGHFGSVAARE